MTLRATLGEHLMKTASAKMFYIAIDYKNKTYMEEAARNIKIKMHQLFPKHRILGVHMTIAQH